MNKLLETIIRTTQSELKAKLAETLKCCGYEPIVNDGYVYAKGELPVLMIAHMDTVHKSPVTTICYSEDGDTMMSPQGIGGDDRCGVYAILKLIAMGYVPHILFTEDEEIGCVGASKFAKSDIKPTVNYIIEFDRRGSDDCVFYDCDNPEFQKFCESFGFVTNFGSCSDISYVAPALGVAAVNLSSGYYNEHTQHEYIVISELERNIERVMRMFNTKVDKPFEYIEAVYNYKNWKYAGWDEEAWEEYDDYYGCIEVSPVDFENGEYVVDGNGDMITEDMNGMSYGVDFYGEVYLINPNALVGTVLENVYAYDKAGEFLFADYETKFTEVVTVVDLEEFVNDYMVGSMYDKEIENEEAEYELSKI